MSGNEKDCKITLYLDTPKVFLKPGFDKTYGSLFFGGIKDSTWLTGHAFIGITDEKGNEQKWGYGPTEAAGDNLLKYTLGCESYFKNEDNTHYNEAIIYPISRKQYDDAAKKIEEIKQNKGEYRLFSRNCSTTSSSILKAAGVMAPSMLISLTPHGLTLKKRLMFASRRIMVAFIKTKNKLTRLFGGKAIPKMKILETLRNKPIPVSVKEGTKSSDKKRSLNVNAALNAFVKKNIALVK